MDVNGTSETSETSDGSDSGVKDYKFKHFSLQHWENQRYQLQTDNRLIIIILKVRPIQL